MRRQILFIVLLAGLLSACARPDFKATTPSKIAVKQAGETSFEVGIERTDGLKDAIEVSLEGLPAGVTSIPVQSGIDDKNVRVVLNAQPNAKTGDYTHLTINMESGDLKHTASLAIQILPLSGSLDTGFGQNGIISRSYGVALERDHVRTAIKAGDKILLGGQLKNSFSISRFGLEGQPDTSFGENGTVRIPGAYGVVQFIFPLASEKILLVGGNLYGYGPFTLVRLNKDGKLDASFGKKGISTYNIGTIPNISIADAKVSSDGHIVIIGNYGAEMGPSGGILSQGWFVMRLQGDGKPDASFGKNGKKIVAEEGFTSDLNYPTSLYLQDEGKILVLFRATTSIYDQALGNSVEQSDYLITRFAPDGSLDITFGRDGRILGNSGAEFITPQEMVVMTDGSLLISLVSRATAAYSSESRAVLVRLTPDGALDASFGSSGQATIPMPINRLNHLIPIEDGFMGIAFSGNVDETRSLAKITPEGALNTEFNYDGLAGGGIKSDIANLLLTPESKWLVISSNIATFQDYEPSDAFNKNLAFTQFNP